MHFWNKIRQYGWIPGVVAGVVCIVLGGVYGQFEVIFKKAVMICMECIGIG